MSAALLAALTIGSASCVLPGTWDFEILYEDDIVEEYTANGSVLTFTPRPYRRWQARTRVDGGPWSLLGNTIPSEPYPGDTNFDCVVSVVDYWNLIVHWNEGCP